MSIHLKHLRFNSSGNVVIMALLTNYYTNILHYTQATDGTDNVLPYSLDVDITIFISYWYYKVGEVGQQRMALICLLPTFPSDAQ